MEIMSLTNCSCRLNVKNNKYDIKNIRRMADIFGLLYAFYIDLKDFTRVEKSWDRPYVIGGAAAYNVSVIVYARRIFGK